VGPEVEGKRVFPPPSFFFFFPFPSPHGISDPDRFGGIFFSPFFFFPGGDFGPALKLSAKKGIVGRLGAFPPSPLFFPFPPFQFQNSAKIVGLFQKNKMGCVFGFFSPFFFPFFFFFLCKFLPCYWPEFISKTQGIFISF